MKKVQRMDVVGERFCWTNISFDTILKATLFFEHFFMPFVYDKNLPSQTSIYAYIFMCHGYVVVKNVCVLQSWEKQCAAAYGRKMMVLTNMNLERRPMMKRKILIVKPATRADTLWHMKKCKYMYCQCKEKIVWDLWLSLLHNELQWM